MKRIVFLALIALAAIGAYFGYRMYQQPVATADDRAAEIVVAAEAIFNEFNTDEAAANARYIDRVVQVTGTVREIGTEGNGPVNVLLETGDALGAVVCEFARDQAPEWEKGQQVTVKGFCAGFNMDVLLQRCAAVE